MIRNPRIAPKKHFTLLLICTGTSTPIANGGVDHDYTLTLYLKRIRNFLGFSWVELQEFDCFIYRPDIKPKFQSLEANWEYLDNFVTSIGLSDGDRPAGYDFVPSDHC